MEAISALEQIGIIYQDIKPENILLVPIIIKGKIYYKLYLCDMGAAFFVEDGQKTSEIRYGSIKTSTYYSKKLNNALQI